MFAVVNGYPCMSSCDAAVARRNIDPRNPHNDPVKAAQLAEKDVLAGKAPPDPLKVEAIKQSEPSTLDPNRLVDRYV